MRSPVPTPAAAAAARPALGTWQVLARVLVGLASFAGALAALHLVAAPGGGGTIGSKQEHYFAHADRYDTVFLGTSHVFRGFVPEEFDRAMEEAGFASSSFNLGTQLPNQLELHYLFRRVLTAGRGRLSRVLVQYHPWMPQIEPGQDFMPRNVYWHDVPETALAVERVLATDGLSWVEADPDSPAFFAEVGRALPARLRLVLQHVEHCVVRALLVGRSKDVLKGLAGAEHGQTAVMGRRRGYVSLEEEVEGRLGEGAERNPYTRRREHFLEDLEAYRREVERLASEPVFFGDADWMDADLQLLPDWTAYARMAEEARAAGVELVIVFMPANSCDRPLEDRIAREAGAPVLRYNDPVAFPRFYEPALRFDSGHLSAAGAREFSRVLAGDVARLLREESRQ